MVRVIIPGGESEETDRPHEPLAMARLIQDTLVEEDHNEVKFREYGIGTVEVENFGGGVYSAKFHAHESRLENEFSFQPIPDAEIGGSTLQGTPLEEMGGKPGELAKMLKNAFDSMPWEFAELEAASLGHSNFTSYEFTYETSFDRRELEDATFP